MSSTALIQASHLHRYYANTHAVNDVSIELFPGDILGLLGPNGAGKSSCLQMLCGTLAPSVGQILINGIDLLDQPRQAKQHIGYLPDKPPLYPELNVDEYLNYCARLRACPSSQIDALREQAKQRCGLSQQGRRLIANLSKGFQQRLGIAQAIIHQPRIIVLDEPTVGLDPIQILEIRQLIAELGEDHGIILSTHILPEVQAVCNRIQMIHQGRCVFNKAMRELNAQPQAIVQLQNPPSQAERCQAELLNINGVDSVETLGAGQFRLSGKNLRDSLSDISQYCVEKQWGLLELYMQANNLEQTFLQLTSGDTSHNTEQQPPTTNNGEQAA